MPLRKLTASTTVPRLAQILVEGVAAGVVAAVVPAEDHLEDGAAVHEEHAGSPVPGGGSRRQEELAVDGEPVRRLESDRPAAVRARGALRAGGGGHGRGGGAGIRIVRYDGSEASLARLLVLASVFRTRSG
jgi:hypothetical protein